MSNFPLSIFINEPQKLNYFTAYELARFAKKVWQKDPQCRNFLKSYLKDIFYEKSPQDEQIKKAIANTLGYTSFSDLNNNHKSTLEAAVKALDGLTIPKVGETVVKYGGFKSDSFRNLELISALVIDYPVLKIFKDEIDKIFDWIAFRKNSILANPNTRNLLNDYCLMRILMVLPLSEINDSSKRKSNSEIVMESLSDFNIVNLPPEFRSVTDNQKNMIYNIDRHHFIEPEGEYIKVRTNSGLLTDEQNEFFNTKPITNLKLFNSVKEQYGGVFLQVEEYLDARSEADFNIELEKPVDDFYNLLKSFDKQVLMNNIYGLEFIRTALILLTELNKDNFRKTNTIHNYLTWGLDLLNPESLEVDESIKERLIQFI